MDTVASALFLTAPIAAAAVIACWPSRSKRAHRRQLRDLRSLRPVTIPHQRTEDTHDQ